MSINLHISGDDAGMFESNLHGVMRLLAHKELGQPAAPVSTVPPPAAEPQREPVEGDTGPEQTEPEPPQEDQEQRIYGQAGDGRKRRTKAEMAEDEEIDNLCDELGVDKAKLNGKVAAAVLAELQEASAEQSEEGDKEPEQTDDGEVLADATREDMQAAMKRYVDRHGMAAAQEKLPGVMGYAKQSDVPDDPQVFAQIIAKIDEAVDG